ncbi:hypothetical protein GCM10023238_10310 [Streptomyces heliomycini]
MQLQMEYYELARKYVEERFGADADEQTKDVLARWEDTLTPAGERPRSLAGELDWVAKRELMEGYRRRDGPGLGRAARLHLVDLQYADVRPEKGLYKPSGGPGTDEAAAGRGRGRAGPVRSLRRTPGRTSAGAVWSSTRTTSRRPSWDSVIFDLRAGTRCRGSQPWKPLAERVITSRSSWDRCRTRKTWSGAVGKLSGYRGTREGPPDRVEKRGSGNHRGGPRSWSNHGGVVGPGE